MHSWNLREVLQCLVSWIFYLCNCWLMFVCKICTSAPILSKNVWFIQVVIWNKILRNKHDKGLFLCSCCSFSVLCQQFHSRFQTRTSFKFEKMRDVKCKTIYYIVVDYRVFSNGCVLGLYQLSLFFFQPQNWSTETVVLVSKWQEVDCYF